MSRQKILFIGLVWPEPTSSAAGWRILQLVELFLNQNHEVYFASTAQKSPYSHDLIAMNVTEIQIELNDKSFDEMILNLQPEIVVFDRFMVEEQFSWRVKENCPNALRILDTEDLHFLRSAREQAYKKDKQIDEFIFSDLTKRELASILRSDLSLIISEFEMKLLQNQFKIDTNLLMYLPFLENNTQVSNLKYEERKDFCFIGNFIHEPNYQTVLKLKKIWPKIRTQLKNVELHIYGAYATQKVEQLHNEKEGFIIKGRAEDARKTLENYRVLLAPIPFGAGVKGKFVDAMSVGTPSISSSIGVEAMQHKNWPGFVSDDENELIEQSILLYSDQTIWQKNQQFGYALLEEKFDVNKFETQFFACISDIIANLENHRNQNFMGEILWFENNMATKYLSKWIEEKNKKS